MKNSQLSTLSSPTFFTALALSNDAQPDTDGKVIGDPTETALYTQRCRPGFGKEDLERNLDALQNSRLILKESA